MKRFDDGLEGGDGIEGLPRRTFRITMPNGLTYHPQNEALLQWFAFASPSSELDGAYSHPDITTLTALSARQKAGGAPRNFEPSPRTKEQGADRERAPFCFACIVSFRWPHAWQPAKAKRGVAFMIYCIARNAEICMTTDAQPVCLPGDKGK